MLLAELMERLIIWYSKLEEELFIILTRIGMFVIVAIALDVNQPGNFVNENGCRHSDVGSATLLPSTFLVPVLWNCSSVCQATMFGCQAEDLMSLNLWYI